MVTSDWVVYNESSLRHGSSGLCFLATTQVLNFNLEIVHASK